MKHRCWEGEDKITQKETDNTEIHFMSLMNLHDTNVNTRLDYLYRRIMVFFMLYLCLLDLFSTLFLKTTPIYQIPWSSEVIHQEHWKADLYWILLSDLKLQAYIGIPKIRPSLHLSSSQCGGNPMLEPGSPLKDIRIQPIKLL